MIVSINIISLMFLRMEDAVCFFKVRFAMSYIWFIVKKAIILYIS
jgi:hypothetical protein